MRDLGHLQNQLLSDIFSGSNSGEFESKGLAIYQANLRATATRALSITFPTLYQLLGEQALSVVSERLLQFCPPQHGDWALWGNKLSAFLAEQPELQDYPFLPDCAELDYHCHQIVRQSFVTTDFESLRLLESEQPDDLMLALNPTLMLMQSDFPIADIRQIHQQAQSPLDALEQVMQAREEQHYLACYLNHAQIQIQKLTATEFAWLNTLQKQSLGEALTEFQNAELSFEIWLTKAVQTNLLNKVVITK